MVKKFKVTVEKYMYASGVITVNAETSEAAEALFAEVIRQK